MKTTYTSLSFFFGLVTILVFSPAALGQMTPDNGKILALKGDVHIQLPGEASPQEATIGQPVPEGAKLFTASGSKVMVGLTKGASTLLEEDSTLEVNNLKVKKKGNRITRRDILLEVDKGSTLSFLKSTGDISDFKVKTTVGIAAARGTIWRSGSNSIQVVDGVVSVTLPGGQTVSVPAGKQVTADGTVDVIDQAVLDALVAAINNNTNLDASISFNSDGTASLIIKNAQGETISSPSFNPINNSDEDTNNSSPAPPTPEPTPATPPPMEEEPYETATFS